jgi:methionine-rich copper-binding protein CopC
MSRPFAVQRYTKSRRSFSLEALEPRWLLSVQQPASDVTPAVASSLAPLNAVQDVIKTDPANGDQLKQSPGSLVVTFNQEVDFVWADGSVLLDRVNADGSLTLMFDLNNLPVATFDPTGFQATIPLDQPLTPGHYRLVLAGGSGVSQFLDDGSWDSSTDQPLADFTVAPPSPPVVVPPGPPVVLPPGPPVVVPPGATLKDATDLGTLGPQVQSVPGTLDLSGGQCNVALYKVTLGPGHFWRLGVELDAQQISSGLRGALTLFDQSGHVLATRDAGTGLASFPADPYLFSGLNPGVYYVGVSGAGNLAGQPGGYNPVAGTIGTTGQSQAGGPFTLKVVTDTADAPTKMSGFALTWQDPLSPSPTGFTISFSGLIDPNTLLTPLADVKGLQVVDANGKSWPVECLPLQNNQQLSFVFGQHLPAGRYSLEIPASGGLKDLAGRSPVGLSLTGNLLATWNVAPRGNPAAPNDLGVVWPAALDGISQTATIAPGQTMVYRVVLPADGLYMLQTEQQSGALNVQRLGSDGLVVLNQNTSAPLYQHFMNLKAGVYLISMTAVGTNPASVQWILRPPPSVTAAEILNGVGQSAALTLRLATSTTSGFPQNTPGGTSTVSPENVAIVSSPTGPVSTPPPTPPSPSGVQLAFAAASSPSASPGGLAPIPASLLVTVNSGLLGGALGQSEALAVVGPAVPGGSVALTDSSSGLMRGILYVSRGTVEDQTAIRPEDSPGLAATDVADRSSIRSTFSGAAASPGAAASLEAAQRSSQADAAALVQADRLAGIAAMLGRLLSLGSGPDEVSLPQSCQTAPQELLADAAAAQPGPANGELDNTRADRIEHAEIGVPTTLLLASAAAYRLRQLTSNWWRRSHDRKAPPKRPQPSGLGPGPRSFRKKTGATCGQRKSLKC